MSRRMPPSGINLFQQIYVLIREYTERTGLPPLNLSLGNPDGVPDGAILRLQAACAGDTGYEYHTYAEDRDLEGFAGAMAELHGRVRCRDFPHLRTLPIAGIKTATALIPLACGLHLPDRRRRESFALASNLPAYDVIGAWSEGYLGTRRVTWPLLAAENMRLNLGRLLEALRRGGHERPDLVFVVRPGNPASVGASTQEWKSLIEFCIERRARLVNDGAYAGLAGEGHSPLAVVAKDYPELDWLELYSVSKSFSDPGARLGAMIGSKDFVEDYALVKGNTDSGPVPSVMAAYGRFLRDREAAAAVMRRLRELYVKRIEYLAPRLKRAGLREACGGEDGFFTLWQAPRRVLGMDLGRDAGAHGLGLSEAFNRLVVSETGIVGVHFQGPPVEGRSEPLIRYAACTDVLASGFQSRFEEQLARLKPEY